MQHAQAALLSVKEFEEFSRASDLAILEQAGGLWCNMLHLHGENVYFDALKKYPHIQIINWHDRETPPSLEKALTDYQGVVCGGLNRETLVYQTPADIEKEANEAFQQTRSKQMILSTGCVVPILAPHGNWLAARRAVETT